MKELQNKPKPALSEMSGFMPVDEKSFYINSTFIKTIDQIVTKGTNYILIYFGINGELQFESTQFIDAYMSPNEDVAIKLLNNRDGSVQTIDLSMEGWPSIYVLVDIHSFAIEMNIRFTDKKNPLPSRNNRVMWSDVVQLVREETKKWLEESVLLNFDF